MSRIDGDTKGYREYDCEFGFHFDEEGNFETKNDEFLLNEPDVLIHIHFFIIECLLCNLDNIGLFIFDKYQKIYFNDEVLKIIKKTIDSNINSNQASQICKNKDNLHSLVEKIVRALYEEYIQNNVHEKSKESAFISKQQSEEETQTDLNKSFYISYPDTLYLSKKLTLNVIFKYGQFGNFIDLNDISLDLSSEEDNSINENFYENLRNRNEFNKRNDPLFYHRYQYANASKEGKQLMDLLNDNDNINTNNNIIMKDNNGPNNILYIESKDLMSLNVTDFSSRKNLLKYNVNPYNNAYINNNNNLLHFN
jgi:hypothetical protein